VSGGVTQSDYFFLVVFFFAFFAFFAMALLPPFYWRLL
jgi:hypothetical protein